MSKPYNKGNVTSVQSKARTDEEQGKYVYNSIKRIAWLLIKQLPKDEQLKTAEFLSKSFSGWVKHNGESTPVEPASDYRATDYLDMQANSWKEQRLLHNIPTEADIILEYEFSITHPSMLTDYACF